jgi:hypothetical protein
MNGLKSVHIAWLHPGRSSIREDLGWVADVVICEDGPTAVAALRGVS